MNILVGNLLRSLQLCWQIDYGTDGSVSRQGASDDYGYGDGDGWESQSYASIPFE